MADLQGTTVIHGNHGFFMFDGNIIGRARNVNMTVEGSLDEFYEVGSAWLADMEVINRKVTVTIERGAIDFSLLAYAVGVQADILPSLTGTSADVSFYSDEADKTYDLIIDEGVDNTLSVSNSTNQVITSPFTLDVVIAANKIVSATSVLTYFVTAKDCKIVRHGISAPQSAFWTTNMDLTGKQIALGGISHDIT